MKTGDIVIVQFGHNETRPLDDAFRARGTLPGVGDESRDIENPILKVHETVHTYGWYMTKYVTDTIAKGAIAIQCSPVPRKSWKNGTIVRNADTFGGWARQVALQQHIGFIELNQIITSRYDALGEDNVEPLFGDPHTHTSRSGAELNANCVVAGLKALPMSR